MTKHKITLRVLNDGSKYISLTELIKYLRANKKEAEATKVTGKEEEIIKAAVLLNTQQLIDAIVEVL